MLTETRKPLLMYARILQALILSLFVGTLFFRTPLTQGGAEARIGYLFFCLSTQAFQTGIVYVYIVLCIVLYM